MSSTRLEVSRTIDAAAQDLYAILRDPRRHAELDGSGMVRSDDAAERITGTGQVFRMNVHHPTAGDYRTDNHVTRFDADVLLSWQTSAVDAEPAGWEWTYHLDAIAPDRTRVTLTYDWSKVTDQAVLERVRFPVVGQDGMERTLENLAAAVA